MPFEAKPYFRNEMSSQVSKIANGVQKSIGLVWDNIEAMFDGENRQKAAEKEARKLLTALANGGVDYGQFLTIATFYDNSNYSYRDITGANLAAALQRAVLNKNNAHVVQSFYTSLTSTRAKNHREGKAFANWVVPLNTGAVRARDYVNHEGVILADRPIIEWYLNDSAHERIFTKFDDPRAWYTNGGTHPGFVNPEWWISPSEGNWQRIV
jgi:hypothetical protein